MRGDTKGGRSAPGLAYYISTAAKKGSSESGASSRSAAAYG
jgi:hypothetical protein